MIKIKKGLNLPLQGSPLQEIHSAGQIRKVALVGADYIGMKPTMLVKVGDSVRIGQKLFEDKKNQGVFYTSPACGKIIEINRGAKRVFQSMVIEVSGQDAVTFDNYKQKRTEEWDESSIRALLIESGLWPALKTRPFSKAPAVKAPAPRALFITASDTNPLAANPQLIIKEHEDDFKVGVEVLSKLTAGKTHVCVMDQTQVDLPSNPQIELNRFSGCHPAGNVGTHIHHLHPVSDKRIVWAINYQDAIAVGKLFRSGKLWNERIISVAGPGVKNPRLMKVPQGACLDELMAGEISEAKPRVISGSVLNGRHAIHPFCFLGRYHQQVCVIEEDTEREFLGWHSAGFNKFSLKNIYVSKLMAGKKFNLGSSTHGSPRAMVPVGMFEKVMPLDILPTQLLRALVTRDTDSAQALGALELDEEDLSLCTFASPGKIDFGPHLRESLTMIEKEG